MENKNVSYVRIEKDNVLLLVPTVRDRGFGMQNQILWSLKEFEYKVFAYLDVDYLISRIINERATSGLPFYDIDMDMYDLQTYPDTIESIVKEGWDYAVMRQTYRYFDQLIANFSSETPHFFAVSCRWHSNSHQALQVYPLDGQYLGMDSQKELTILFSSYSEYSEKYLEDLLITIGRCKKLSKDYQSWNGKSQSYRVISTQHLIKKHNSFFLFKNGEIYCGLDWVNPNILLKVNWRVFTNEMIHPKGCKDCNPGYKMKVALSDTRLNIFEHKLLKDYAKNFGNDCYSEATQFINIINTQWKRISDENPFMKKVVFEIVYDEGGRGKYVVVTYLNVDWEGPSRKISYTCNSDYLLQKREEIALAL